MLLCIRIEWHNCEQSTEPIPCDTTLRCADFPCPVCISEPCAKCGAVAYPDGSSDISAIVAAESLSRSLACSTKPCALQVPQYSAYGDTESVAD